MSVMLTPEPPVAQQTAGAETDATPQPVSPVSPRPVQDLGGRLWALVARVARLLAAWLAQSQGCPRCRAPWGEYADVRLSRQYQWDSSVHFLCRVCEHTWEESTWSQWWWD